MFTAFLPVLGLKYNYQKKEDFYEKAMDYPDICVHNSYDYDFLTRCLLRFNQTFDITG